MHARAERADACREPPMTAATLSFVDISAISVRFAMVPESDPRNEKLQLI